MPACAFQPFAFTADPGLSTLILARNFDSLVRVSRRVHKRDFVRMPLRERDAPLQRHAPRTVSVRSTCHRRDTPASRHNRAGQAVTSRPRQRVPSRVATGPLPPPRRNGQKDASTRAFPRYHTPPDRRNQTSARHTAVKPRNADYSAREPLTSKGSIC